MAAYYNDNDADCGQWLRNLIAAGLLPEGDVDERPIEEVQPEDLKGYAQVHLFAGLGGWGLATRLAGWPDDRPIWTGSCPCQPFSVAGRRKGVEDSRHLWPEFYRLICASRPAVIMGEQVAGAAGYAWLSGVGSDLEAEGYAWRAVDIPACAIGAPHRRNRLFWVADSQNSNGRRTSDSTHGGRWTSEVGGSGCVDNRLAHSHGPRLEGRESERGDDGAEREAAERSGGAGGGMGDAKSDGWGQVRRDTSGNRAQDQGGAGDRDGDAGAVGFWDSWVLVGPDPQGKWRRTKPGILLLAHGIPARVAKLRALGNAIVPPLAAEVIKAYMDEIDAAKEAVMPSLITAKRLTEIKARVKEAKAQGWAWGYASASVYGHAPDDIPDLIATLERAVELLRVMSDSKDGYHRTLMPSSAIEFLKEFDHDKPNEQTIIDAARKP